MSKKLNNGQAYRDLCDILERTNKNDPSSEDVNALRTTLIKNPGFWKKYGNLARLTQDKIIDSIPASSAIKESIWRAAPEMRREFGFDECPLIEQLLIELVILHWLHYHRMQYAYEFIIGGTSSLKIAQHWDRCVASAQRSYLRAIEALARVRKIGGRVNLQINIGQNQINNTT